MGGGGGLFFFYLVHQCSHTYDPSLCLTCLRHQNLGGRGWPKLDVFTTVNLAVVREAGLFGHVTVTAETTGTLAPLVPLHYINLMLAVLYLESAFTCTCALIYK